MQKECLSERDGFKVYLALEEYAECPWGSWDQFTQASTVSRSHIGAKGAPKFSSPSEFEDFANDPENDVEGFEFSEEAAIWYTKADRIKEFGKGPHACKKARALLKAEAQLWNDWANGEVYYYFIKDEKGETVDSCGGYYGHKDAKEQALEALNTHVQWEKEQSAKVAACMAL